MSFEIIERKIISNCTNSLSFHAILTPAPDVPLEKTKQFIKGGFSYRAKKELNFNFDIWQKESKEHRIKDAADYEAHVEYIWNNPVRAGLVNLAEEFSYSSARLRNLVDPAPAWVRLRRSAQSA